MRGKGINYDLNRLLRRRAKQAMRCTGTRRV